MDKSQVRQQAAEMRQSLLDEGILNEQFLRVETLEENEPNFVENVIRAYLSQSVVYLEELQQTIEIKSLDLANGTRLINKLRGGSASLGAGRFNELVMEMWDAFKAQDDDRLAEALERATAGQSALKLRLEPYAELLQLLREDVAPDEASEIQDGGDMETESVDSNVLD